MSQEKNDNTYTAPNQAQKSQKEKTMDTSRTNSLATIDVTQVTTMEEQALITQNNTENTNSPTLYTDNIADYYPGKYQKHAIIPEEDITSASAYSDNIADYYPGKYSENNFVTAEQKKEEKKEGYISSYVGDYDSNPAKNRIANLGNDVAFVQGHLNRLGILSDEHFIAEKPATEKEIDKSKIPHTIVAIEYFQREILSCKVDGEIWPGKGNIKSLVSITVEQKDAKHLEYLKNKKEAEKRAAEEKLRTEAEEKERFRIEKIKMTLPTIENVQAHFDSCGSIEEFGKSLKDYAIHNPLYTLMAYEIMRKIETDDLTRAIMKNMTDSEIAQLHFIVDDHFYETLDSGWTGDEEYALMDKLNAGKKNTLKEEKGSGEFKTVEPIISTDDWRSQGTSKGKGFYPDNEGNGTACKTVSEKMVYRHLYDDLKSDFKIAEVINDKTGKYKYIVGNTSFGEYLSVLKEDKSQFKKIEAKHMTTEKYEEISTTQVAINYLDSYLDQNIPVVVGVDHTFNAELSTGKSNPNDVGYNEGTTDHFITIIAKGKTDKGKKYYQFFDPGTAHRTNATKEGNKLIEEKPGLYKATQPYKTATATKYKTYILTMVLLFKKDKKTYKNEIEDNNTRLKNLKKDYKTKSGDFKL
ncbi:MAG: hypothetical protein JEY96_19890 [Bacteroidales bacterium]|nr:hypothetical protein [Bacteroidales bacterium]